MDYVFNSLCICNFQQKCFPKQNKKSIKKIYDFFMYNNNNNNIFIATLLLFNFKNSLFIWTKCKFMLFNKCCVCCFLAIYYIKRFEKHMVKKIFSTSIIHNIGKCSNIVAKTKSR